ncbi:hypothetical protein HWV62_31549 [Athelia sp. TMB]|nr:hypothetical protein HWV62_31549 [Athelia sp. TMB]
MVNSIIMTAHVGTFFAWVYWDLIVNFNNPVNLNILTRTAQVQLLAILLRIKNMETFPRELAYDWMGSSPQWASGTLQSARHNRGMILYSRGDCPVMNLVSKAVTTIQSAAAAACDFSITIILCVLLHSSRTGIKSTDALLDKLIAYAINRGALTTLAAFLNMLLPQ